MKPFIPFKAKTFPRIVIAYILILLSLTACAREKASLPTEATPSPAFSKNGMVATQEALATKVGVQILKQGGNAVDAAVAIGFTLAVTLPQAGNLGGGGFMIAHIAKTGETVAIDYREMAPALATQDMHLDEHGNPVSERSQFTHLAVGVPGTVAGLSYALKKYGTLTLRQVMSPAIHLAEKGFHVTVPLADSFKKHKKALLRWPETTKIFFKPDGSFYEPGDLLVQKDLAVSLKQIAKEGPRAFYQGAIAEKLAAEMKSHDGLITLADLQNYRVVRREPVRGTYRGYEIVSMPPPSSGGIHLIQMLNILEGYPLRSLGAGNAETLHLLAETMKLAYADRSQHLGDPKFWKVPGRGLTSKAYAENLKKLIQADKAQPSKEILPGDPSPYESPQTTHFSVMDGAGNAVSNTYTLNFGYGTGIVAKGTGILLNNQMDDFSSKPGVPNAYGLVGGEANAIQPMKRPLSSMTPTLVFKAGKPILATGSPGGSRIITSTLQFLLNVLDHKMNIDSATRAPRIHHQWLPDWLEMEPGFKPETLLALAEKGHLVVETKPFGSTQSILRTKKGFYGASDQRRPGALAQGY
ncbi:MAG: gamma-glutamyltransferase [Nitrospinae bacterium]|nr:gamma-glutamyltransferase [Nitrospinota bacterium]MDA1110767.1 gamma-glutamyltransferase [Nitrospinota bacterium]